MAFHADLPTSNADLGIVCLDTTNIYLLNVHIKTSSHF